MKKIPLEIGHICMNHFLLLDTRGMSPLSDSYLFDIASIVCSTFFADDLLILENSDHADVRLRIMGGDRREAEFCGNGMIYTAGKVGAEMQLPEITIESKSGVKQAVKIDEQWQVEVGPVTRLDRYLDSISLQHLKDIPVYGLLRAGEPHLVLFRPGVFPNFHIDRKAFELFCHPLRDITDIAGGVNVTVVFQVEFRSVLIRTFERGVRRQSYSCGTGSVSAVAAVFDTPKCGSAFQVCAPGGMHNVRFDKDRWYVQATPQRIGTGYLQDTTISIPLTGVR